MTTSKRRLKPEEIIVYLKKYAYAFPHGEVYGGIKNVYDFGPLGLALKNQILKVWRKHFVLEQNNIHEMDSAILTLPQILKTSGHIEKFEEKRGWKFTQPFFYNGEKTKTQTNNKKTLAGEADFPFGLLLNVPLLDDSDQKMRRLYLRPETAQGIFVNFNKVRLGMKLTLPFGLAQAGKSFRKEVNSADFIMRAWEFEQMEIEYFFEGSNSKKIAKEFQRWNNLLKDFFIEKLHIPSKYLRNVAPEKSSLPHYAKQTEDWEFQLSNQKWIELASLANRGQYDLTRHNQSSEEEMTVKNMQNEKIIANVVEPSIGINRTLFALLAAHLNYEKNGEKERLVLNLPEQFCYYQIAVLPLTEVLTSQAKKIWENLQKQKWGRVAFFSKKSIGKRYAYQDAIGTKFCVTYDFKSVQDEAVTVRERNTSKQVRVQIKELIKFFNNERTNR